MRIFTFIIYLFLQFLAGGRVDYANTSPSAVVTPSTTQWFTTYKDHFLYSDDYSLTVIEDSDIDFEEELTGNTLKKFHDDKVNFKQNAFATVGYTSKSYLLFSNSYGKQDAIVQPFYSCTSPIYLKNRVLRI